MTTKILNPKFQINIMTNGEDLTPEQSIDINKIITDTINVHIGELAVSGQNKITPEGLESKIQLALKDAGFNSIDISITENPESKQVKSEIEELINTIKSIARGIHDITETHLAEVTQQKISLALMEHVNKASVLPNESFCSVKAFNRFGHLLPTSAAFLLKAITDNRQGDKNTKYATMMLYRVFILSLFSHLLNPHEEDIMCGMIDREQLIQDFYAATQGDVTDRIDELHLQFHQLVNDVYDKEASPIH